MRSDLLGFASISYFLKRVHSHLVVFVLSLLFVGVGHAQQTLIDCDPLAVPPEPVLVGTISSGYQGYLGKFDPFTQLFPQLGNFSMTLVPGTATAVSWRIVRTPFSPEGSAGPDAPGNTRAAGGTLGSTLVVNNLTPLDESYGLEAYIDSINGTATLYQSCSRTPFPVNGANASPIPTLSEWNLGLMALGLLVAATLVLRRRALGR